MPARGELSNGQDWNTVSFSSKPGGNRPASARGGGGTTPRASSGPGPSMAKNGMTMQQLEDNSEDLKHNTVSKELKQAIQAARTAKGLTQKQLANQLQIDAKTINEYESGKAIPNNQVIAKIERALGAKLPRAPKK